jgi:hypothetical protein
MGAAVLLLSAFQHVAQAQAVVSECTNPVCKPGKACAEYRCARPCLDCTPPSSGGSNCVVGYALGNDADFAGGNVPDVLIESTDYWTIDDSGNAWYDGFSTTGPVQETTLIARIPGALKARSRLSSNQNFDGSSFINNKICFPASVAAS